MSKYNSLWLWIKNSGKECIVLSFAEIEQISGLPIDHSFLSFKKELLEYGYRVGKISMTAQTVVFNKVDSGKGA